MVTECPEGTDVGGYCVVGKVTPHDRPEPPSLFGNVLVPASPEVLLDFLEFCPFAIAPRVPGQQEFAPLRLRADMGEPEEVEGFRLAFPSRRSRGRGPSSKLDQTGLIRVQFQVEFRHPGAQVRQEPVSPRLRRGRL